MMSNSQQIMSNREADGDNVEHSEQETTVVDTDYQRRELSLTSEIYQGGGLLLTSDTDYEEGEPHLTSYTDYHESELLLTADAGYQGGEILLTSDADYQVADLPLTSERPEHSAAADPVSEEIVLHNDPVYLEPESVEWFPWTDDTESLLGYFFELTKTNIQEQDIEYETLEMEEVASSSGGFQGISFSGLDSSSSTGLGLDMMTSAEEVTAYSFDQTGSVPPGFDSTDSVSILVSIANAFSHVFLTPDSSNMNNYSEERDEGDCSVLIPDTHQNTISQSCCPHVGTSQKQEAYQDICHSYIDMEMKQECGALNAIQQDKNKKCNQKESSTNIIPGNKDIHVESFLIEGRENTEPNTSGEELTAEMSVQKFSLNDTIDTGSQVPMQHCLNTPKNEYLHTSTVEIIITNKNNMPSSEKITSEVSVKHFHEEAPITTLFSSAKDPFYHIGRFLEKLNTKPEEEQQKLWDLLSGVIKSGLGVQTPPIKPETKPEKGEDLNIMELGDQKQIQLNSEGNIFNAESNITVVDETNVKTEPTLNLEASCIHFESIDNKTEEPDFQQLISRTQSFEQPGLTNQLKFAEQSDSQYKCCENKPGPTPELAMSYAAEQQNNITQVLECSCVNVDYVPVNPNITAATSLPMTDPSPQHSTLSEAAGAQNESSRLIDQMSLYDSSIVRSKVLSVQPPIKLAPLNYGLRLKNEGLTQTSSLASVTNYCQAPAELPPCSLLHLQGQGLSPAQQTEVLSSLITSSTHTYRNNRKMAPAYFNLSGYPLAATTFDTDGGQLTSISALNNPIAGFSARTTGYPQHNHGIPQSFPSKLTAAALRQNDFYNHQISSALMTQQLQSTTNVYPSFYPCTHSITSKHIYDNILNAPYNMVNVPLPFMPTPVCSSNFTGNFGKWQIPPMAPRTGTAQIKIPSCTSPNASHNINTIPYQKAVFKRDTSAGSQLLEDFRIGRSMSVSLGDLTDHMVEFSQDQHGSRFIQQLLERATQQEKNLIFSEISVSAFSLMTDAFGNYVVQKFLELGTREQKQIMIHKFKGHVLSLSLQTYGCRVIQKAIASVPVDLQMEIIQELDGQVVRCALDQNGNHVIQKCVECVEPGQLQFVVDALKFQVLQLASHIYGCRVIQRILEHCSPDQKNQILPELHMGLERLMHDQYGNYVVQHVLEHGSKEDRRQVMDVVQGRLCQLSQHKCASNVVEKCIVHSSCQERAALIDEVCSTVDTISKQSALLTMMENEFANYVVQKMIDLAELPQRKQLMYSIRPLMPNLRKNVYGKYILAKLERFFELESMDGGDC